MTYAVLIPLKATSRGKSRLGVADRPRIALAAAMVRDTLAAVRSVAAVSRVLVIAEDSADAALLAPDGVEACLTGAHGLNRAIAEGAQELTARGWSGPVAVLPGDLPFLTSADLASALDVAGGRPGVVADASGTGTTLLVAPHPALVDPHFGPGSYALHQQAGASPVPVAAGSTLRMDVDTMADLHRAAARRPPGAHTSAVLASWGNLSIDRLPQVTVLP